MKVLSSNVSLGVIDRPMREKFVRATLVAAVLVTASRTVVADGCVVGTETNNIRPDGVHAVSSVLSVDLYPDIKTCNEAQSYLASRLPSMVTMDPVVVDSMTFDCHVPSTCFPNDANSLQPFSRVVYMHPKDKPAAKRP
jgi:hypothetical protein